MRNELKHIEEIEKYLLGEMPQNEKTSFELRMKNDEQLKKDVEFQKNFSQQIAIAGFTSEVKSFHTEWMAANGSSSGWSNWKWILNTFLAILITSISAYSIYQFSGVNPENDTKKENTLASSDSTVKKRKIVSTYSHATMIPSGPLYVEKKTEKKKNSTGNKNDFTNDFSNDGTSGINLEDVLNNVKVPFEEITMDAQEGKEFFTKKSKSRIVFPAGILQHQDGSKVEGEVTIRYREFRNAAEMAFSEIPMTVEQNGETLRMNSTGMIEIRAVQNGEELKIGKNNYFTLDYQTTDNLDSTYFWQLDDRTKKWQCKDTLQYGNPNPEVNEEDYPFGMVIGKIFDAYTGDTIYYADIKLTRIGDIDASDYSAFYNDTGFIMPKVKPGQYLATISKNGYDSFQFRGVYTTKGQMSVLEIHLKPEKHRSLNIFKKFAARKKYNQSLKKVNSKGSFRTFKDIPENLKGEYIMAASTGEMVYKDFSKREKRKNKITDDVQVNQKPSFAIITPQSEMSAKNQFDKTVYGLQLNGFGVYNCDQVSRMKKPVNVRPSFGETVQFSSTDYNSRIVVIDKNLNAAFNFAGGMFSMDAQGKNTLLVYKKGEIYGVKEETVSSLNIRKDGNYDIPLTEITTEIKSTEDLKKYLGL